MIRARCVIDAHVQDITVNDKLLLSILKALHMLTAQYSICLMFAVCVW